MDLDIGGRQLAVKARRFIPQGAHIPECFGAMASDVDPEHTHLSEILKHEDLTGPDGIRLLAGPLRLANHHCKPNCEVCFSCFDSVYFSYISQWVALDRTAGYYALALTDIHEGDELTFDYSPGYFEEIGCPCSAHTEARSPYLVSGFFFRKSSQVSPSP